jgi:sugar/nucleoside kinase (ribokinase family)
MTPDLVVIGNLLVDDIVLPDGRTYLGLAGGASLYLSLAARLWGAEVGVVSVAGSDYPAAMLEALASRGVRLEGVRRLGRPGVRTWLLYEGRVRRVVHRLGSPRHEEVSPGPADLPAAWHEARAFHLSPMPLEVQRSLVAALSGRAGVLLSLDPHEPVREDTLALWRPVLEQLDVLFVSEDELLLEEAHRSPREALRRLAAGRLRAIAYKRGSDGGLLYDVKGDAFIEWPPCREPVVESTVEPTGAGDAFAGGFLAGLLAGLPMRDSLEQAAVSAGLALAAAGPQGLLGTTREEAARLRDAMHGAAGLGAAFRP